MPRHSPSQSTTSCVRISFFLTWSSWKRWMLQNKHHWRSRRTIKQFGWCCRYQAAVVGLARNSGRCEDVLIRFVPRLHPKVLRMPSDQRGFAIHVSGSGCRGCCLHSKKNCPRSLLITSQHYTGPTDTDGFRGHRLTTRKRLHTPRYHNDNKNRIQKSLNGRACHKIRESGQTRGCTL